MRRESDKARSIADAFRRFDEGETVPDILAAFPAESGELAELFATIETLAQARGSTLPSPALLERIIGDVSKTPEAAVTDAGYARSLSRRGNGKGRSSIHETLYQTEPVLMKSRSWLPLGVVAVLVLVFAATQFRGSPDATALNTESLQNEIESIDSLNGDIGAFLESEITLSEIDAFLEDEADEEASAPVNQSPSKAKGAPNPKGKTPSGDSLDSAAIQAELNAFTGDNDLESFLTSEASLDELDSALNEF